MLFLQEFKIFLKNYIAPNSPKITRLDLSRFTIDDEGASILYNHLLKNTHIVQAVYDRTGVNPAIVQQINSHFEQVKAQQNQLRGSFSVADEERISKVQKLYRSNRLYKQMERTTGLHPEKQSIINITRILAELSADCEQLLPINEKQSRGNKALTYAESALFKRLLKVKYFLKHATPHYEIISSTSNRLLSISERQRHKLVTENNHTMAGFFRQDNVYFSMGSAQQKIASFIEEGSLPFVTIETALLPEQFTKSLWFGQHPNKETDAKQFGTTKRFILSSDEDDAHCVNYHYADGKIRHRKMQAKHEVITGNYWRQFFALKLIQELRYLGEPYRSHVLANRMNPAVLEAAIDNLFNFPLYEAKIAVEFKLDQANTTIVQPPPDNRINEQNVQRFNQVIDSLDIEGVEQLLSEGIDVNSKNKEQSTPLLKCLALLCSSLCKNPTLRQKALKLAIYLLDHGADVGVCSLGMSPLDYAVRTNEKELVNRIFASTKLIDTSSLIANIANFSIKHSLFLFHTLSTAVRYCDLQMVQLLVANGAIITPVVGLQALFVAIENDKIDIVRYLLEFKLPINQLFCNTTALIKAIKYNRIAILRLLLDAGANVNLYCQTETSQLKHANQSALMLAVQNEHWDATVLLLDNGAKVNEQDDFGRTALDLTTTPRFIKLLEEYGGKHHSGPIIEYGEKTVAGIALIRAHNDQGLAYYLVGRKKDEQGCAKGSYLLPGGLRDAEDESLLATAAREAFEETSIPLPYLMTHNKVKATQFYRYDQLNSSVDFEVKYQKNTDIRYLSEVTLFDVGSMRNVRPQANDDLIDLKWVSSSDLADLDIMPSNRELILAASNQLVPPNPESNESRDKITVCMRAEYDGGNLLVNAVIRDDIHEVQRLLDSGIAPDALCNLGVTALTLACKNGNLPITEFLLLRGANPNFLCPLKYIDFKLSCSPIHAAFENGHLEIIKLLMSKGANLNIPSVDHPFVSPVFAAAIEGRTQLVKYAFENGYNITQTNRTNQDTFAWLVKELLTNKIDQEIIISLLQLYLDQGANINDKENDYHRTALLWLCNMVGENCEIMKFLLARGADRNICDNSARTPLDYAKINGYDNYIELLKTPENNCKAPDRFFPVKRTREDALDTQKVKRGSGESLDPNNSCLDLH